MMGEQTSGLGSGPFYLLCFPTAHQAIRAQVELDHHVRYLVVPTPQQISVSCGISLKIAAGEKERLDGMIRAGKLPEDSVYLYRVTGRGRSAVYEKIPREKRSIDAAADQTENGRQTAGKGMEHEENQN